MKPIFVLSTLLISLSSFAMDYTLEKCEKVNKEDVLKEAVVHEMLGASLSAKPKCLSKYPFKYTKVAWFPPSDEERIFDYGVDLTSLKILKSELVEEFTGQYKVTFQITSTKQFGSKVFEDSMLIATRLGASIHKEQGCSMMMGKPQNYYLASSCYTKVNGKGN